MDVRVPDQTFEDFFRLLRVASDPAAVEAQILQWRTAREEALSAVRDRDRLSRIDSLETQAKADLQSARQTLEEAKQQATSVRTEAHAAVQRAAAQIRQERETLRAEQEAAHKEIAALWTETERLKAQALTLQQGLLEKQQDLARAEAAAQSTKAEYESKLSLLRQALRE